MLRWSVTALTVATIIAWPLSALWGVWLDLPGGYHLGLAFGRFLFVHWPEPAAPAVGAAPGLPIAVVVLKTARGLHWSFLSESDSHGTHPAIPVWIVLILPAVASAVLWWPPLRAVARRRRCACLNCGYARSGLAPDVPCPECGKVPA